MPSDTVTPKRLTYSLVYEWAIVAAAVILIVFVLIAGAWTWKLDQVLYDAGLEFTERPAREDVVIVTIDNASIDAVGQWPWRRSVLAALVEKISSAKPKAVGLDILFAEPDSQNPGDDVRLATALGHAPHPFLPVIFVQGRQLMPIRSLAEHAELASVGSVLDPDGVLRGVSLEQGEPGKQIPHMAFAMAKLTGMPASAQPGEDFLIPFIGPPGKTQHVSAAAILNGESAPSALAGKFVLIGLTATGLADRYVTPSTTGAQLMAGTEVTANALTALLEGRHIRLLGKYTVGFISAAVMLGLLLIFYRASPALSLYLMFATVIIVPLSAMALLAAYGIWFPPMSVAICALIAYPLWNWKRLESICHFLDEEIVRLERDHSKGRTVLASGLVGFADYIQNRIELIRINVGYLRSARKFLSESLDGLPYAAFVVAPDGYLVVANRHALALCHLQKVTLHECDIDKALTDIKPANTDWPLAMSRALAGEEVELKAANSLGREFEASLAPFRNDEGVVSGLIVVVDDVTQLRQAQREREDALSFLSHDIRSPQNSIMALAELQRHDETRSPETEFVMQVESLAQRTVTLAEEFLQLVRADSKPLNLTEYDLFSLLEDCVAEAEPQARAKKIEVEMPTPGERFTVMVDRSLITRAIGNLLINAIKFTPDEGRVVIRCERQEQNAICSIKDSGPGIQESDMPRLFKRFSRVHNSAAQVAGSGLGLAFVDVVARRHGGSAHVKSVFGSGAMFSIVLPIVASYGAE